MTVTAGKASARGGITLYKALDSAGRPLDDGAIGLRRLDQSRIRLAGPSPDGGFTLAFKVEPPRGTVEFNFLLDGKPATAVTYIGERLSHPAEMPFGRRAGRSALKELGEPPLHPGAPFFLVRHGGRDRRARRPVELDGDVKRELRSLGYIQ